MRLLGYLESRTSAGNGLGSESEAGCTRSQCRTLLPLSNGSSMRPNHCQSRHAPSLPGHPESPNSRFRLFSRRQQGGMLHSWLTIDYLLTFSVDVNLLWGARVQDKVLVHRESIVNPPWMSSVPRTNPDTA